MSTTGTVQYEFTIRRKILTLFGAKFHITDGAGKLVGFSKQKAFRLKEDIRVFTDESLTTPLIAINARNIIDFSAAYDVTNSQNGEKIGALRRKGMTSIVQDEWTLMDASDSPIARIHEDSTALALIRRFVPMGNLVPQKFRVGDNEGRLFAEYSTHFNPFVHKMTVKVYSDSTIDPQLLLAGGILLVAIEGRQG